MELPTSCAQSHLCAGLPTSQLSLIWVWGYPRPILNSEDLHKVVIIDIVKGRREGNCTNNCVTGYGLASIKLSNIHVFGLCLVLALLL